MRLMRMSTIAGTLMATAITVGAGAASASAATTVVRPSAMDGWTAQTNDATGTAVPFGTCANGAVSFVNGPATPPLGVGSAELTTGDGTSGGDCDAQLRNSDYAGVKLSDLTSLSYYTYVKKNNGSQAPFITLYVNWEGNANGTADDLIFFEPPYQTTTTGNPSLPDQGPVAYNTWQSWNADEGGWWADTGGGSGTTGCTPGTGVCSLATYESQHPNAVIVNDPVFGPGGGLTVGVGYASPSDQFDSNVDDFTVGVSGTNTTYDFEPNLPTPTSANQCKNGGWQNYTDNNGTPFKNQGDCVSYVATGGTNPANG